MQLGDENSESPGDGGGGACSRAPHSTGQASSHRRQYKERGPSIIPNCCSNLFQIPISRQLGSAPRFYLLEIGSLFLEPSRHDFSSVKWARCRPAYRAGRGKNLLPQQVLAKESLPQGINPLTTGSSSLAGLLYVPGSPLDV